MANNFLHFSFVVKATLEQAKWLAAVDERARKKIDSKWGKKTDAETEPTPVDGSIIQAADALADGRDSPPGIDVDYDERRYNSIWIRSNGSGDPEYAADLAQQLLCNFGLDEPISFRWAETCSAMRVDEFGGGAVVITRNEILWLNTATWVQQTINSIKNPGKTREI